MNTKDLLEEFGTKLPYNNCIGDKPYLRPLSNETEEEPKDVRVFQLHLRMNNN